MKYQNYWSNLFGSNEHLNKPLRNPVMNPVENPFFEVLINMILKESRSIDSFIHDFVKISRK